MDSVAINKKINKFLLILFAFAVVCILFYFEHRMNPQDTTIFAFSYKYGFISRGLLGTIWQGLDKILPFSIMNFEAIYFFTIVVTVIFFVMLFVFFKISLKRVAEKDLTNTMYIIVFFSVFTFPMFLTLENFGRLDEYLVLLTVICCVLIVIEKVEWLIIPICTFCVILHQGFVFMNVNIILVLLFYKMLMCERKKRKYYIFIFATVLVICSVFFLYFELFSHVRGELIYDEIVSTAKSLSQTGEDFSESLVNHEILGLDVYEEERVYHLMNKDETPIFLAFFCPYIIMGIMFFVRLFKNKSTKEKWVYAAVVAGAVTILPEAILKVDFGRYIYAALFYYLGIVICLMAMNDKGITSQVDDTLKRIKNVVPASKVLIVYPFIFMPFLDVHITQRIWDLVQIMWDM